MQGTPSPIKLLDSEWNDTSLIALCSTNHMQENYEPIKSLESELSLTLLWCSKITTNHMQGTSSPIKSLDSELNLWYLSVIKISTHARS